MRTIVLCLALSTTLLLPACKGGDSCGQLVKKICADGGPPCDKASKWLDSEMTGPNHEKLPDSQKAQACSAILGDKDALTGYIAGAKTELAK